MSIVSFLGIVAIIIKYRMEATWRHFDNPMKFYRKILRQQVDVGLADKELMNLSTIRRGNPFCWMMGKKGFWVEIIIMCIFPLPIDNKNTIFGLKTITIECVNWVDPSNDGYPLGSHIYDTPYLTNDIFLALMFLRFYFILQTMIVWSPPNNRLIGKRVCHEFGIETDFNY